MRKTLNIHRDISTFPRAADVEGVVNLGTRLDYHFVHSENLCQMVSGMEFAQVNTDIPLTRDEILWMISRIRGDEVIEPTGSNICIWRCKYGNKINLAIGLEQVDLTLESSPRGEELNKFIDEMLLETFH